jgi:proteasome lid subunit RPN8/RPN11
MITIVCTQAIVRATIDILRRGAAAREERVVLWLSAAAVRIPASVVEVYEPDQVTEIDFFRLPPASMRALMDHLRSTRRRVVAQIHTHPGPAYHSEADAAWAIVSHIGALSLVLPRFAATTTLENFLEEVVTYEYTSAGDWDHRPNMGPGARLTVMA